MKRQNEDPTDLGLWDAVKRSIKPLRISRAKGLGIGASPTAKPSGVVHRPAFAGAIVRDTRRALSPPPLAAFDRRMAQRLSRGQLEPDASLDLHGDGLEVARIKLFHFIDAQRRHGTRLILVITGKGASPFTRHTLHGVTAFHSPEREGRLRREVPMWLHEAPFREHVVGFQPAHPRHGGGGAYYLRLRKLPEHP